MHELHIARASIPLFPFIRCFAQRRVEGRTAPLVQPLPARLEQIVEFQFDELYAISGAHGGFASPPRIAVVGLYTRNDCEITFLKNVTSFAIFFQPDGFSRLFGIPQAELSHNAFDGCDMFGRELDRLHDQLASCETFRERVAVAERYLESRARSAVALFGPIERAAAHIFRKAGIVRVADIAAGAGLSLRQFERRFQHYSGIKPKIYGRVARFQFALDRKASQPWTNWLGIAHELGYHDQMHMIRDFHDFAGCPPEEIFASLGHARPEGLVSRTREQPFYRNRHTPQAQGRPAIYVS